MMRQVLQGGLEAELDEELGYTRYDYRNKETENSRNGFSKKTMHTSIGDMEIEVPRDRQGVFEPRLIKTKFSPSQRNGKAGRWKRSMLWSLWTPFITM